MKVKNMSKKIEKTSLEDIKKELCSLFDYCKDNGMTTEEMRVIFKPLVIKIRRAIIMKWLKILITFAIIILIIYLLIQVESIQWHLSAIGRIAMIKLLPFWNWEKLSNENCLIPNYFTQTSTNQNFDCTLCEGIDSIVIESNIDPYDLSELYLDVNIPVIISDGLKNWPTISNSSFNLFQSILDDNVITSSLPCELSTNMFSKLNYVDVILKKSTKFKKWFYHFQNCEIDAMKQFRLLAPRPYFFRAEISPIQYNWLVMSSKYEAPKFKQIHLNEKYAVFGQLVGSNFVKLIPRLNCENECPVLEVELKRGEALVVTSLWDLEYLPNPDTNNTAIILEAH